MKLTIKQLKQIIKEQVEETGDSADTRGFFAKHDPRRPEDLDDMLDKLIDATTNAVVYDDQPKQMAMADRDIKAIRVRIHDFVRKQIDGAVVDVGAPESQNAK